MLGLERCQRTRGQNEQTLKLKPTTSVVEQVDFTALGILLLNKQTARLTPPQSNTLSSLRSSVRNSTNQLAPRAVFMHAVDFDRHLPFHVDPHRGRKQRLKRLSSASDCQFRFCMTRCSSPRIDACKRRIRNERILWAKPTVVAVFSICWMGGPSDGYVSGSTRMLRPSHANPL